MQHMTGIWCALVEFTPVNVEFRSCVIIWQRQSGCLVFKAKILEQHVGVGVEELEFTAMYFEHGANEE